MLCFSCRVFLPCMLIARTIPLETIERRQCTVLCNRCCLGCMQRYLGNTFIRFYQFNAHKPYAGHCITIASMPIPWIGCNICGTRISLRESKDYHSFHITAGQCFTICYAGNSYGIPSPNPNSQHMTKGYQLVKNEFTVLLLAVQY